MYPPRKGKILPPNLLQKMFGSMLKQICLGKPGSFMLHEMYVVNLSSRWRCCELPYLPSIFWPLQCWICVSLLMLIIHFFAPSNMVERCKMKNIKFSCQPEQMKVLWATLANGKTCLLCGLLNAVFLFHTTRFLNRVFLVDQYLISK